MLCAWPPHTTETHYISDISSQWFLKNLTDVVAAGGSDGLVDYLLTHDTVELQSYNYSHCGVYKLIK